MHHSFQEYREEVLENICELEGCDLTGACQFVEGKHGDIEYGHKYRLAPSIVAGAILGINECCVTSMNGINR